MADQGVQTSGDELIKIIQHFLHQPTVSPLPATLLEFMLTMALQMRTKFAPELSFTTKGSKAWSQSLVMMRLSPLQFGSSVHAQ
jgi:hypothetical protein